MREQHRMLAEATRPVAILTDTACDLPDDVLDQHGIGMVPLQVIAGDRVYRDRIELRPAEVYHLMRTSSAPLTTSQPTVAQFRQGYEHARAGADRVVGIFLSSGLSGTYANAESAAQGFAAGGLHLVDSRSASLGTGLLALRAAELAEAGWTPEEIVAEVQRLRTQNGLFFTVDTLENLVRSGRVSRLRGWLGGVLDMKPILSFGPDGRITPVDRVRGRAAQLPRILELLDDAMPRERRRLRMGVVHADCEHVAREVRDALHRRFHPYDILINPVTAVIGVHAGPGAWGVFYQVEDGIPERPGNNSADRTL
jgi:DegV family protein with EDD domain